MHGTLKRFRFRVNGIREPMNNKKNNKILVPISVPYEEVDLGRVMAHYGGIYIYRMRGWGQINKRENCCYYTFVGCENIILPFSNV